MWKTYKESEEWNYGFQTISRAACNIKNALKRGCRVSSAIPHSSLKDSLDRIALIEPVFAKKFIFPLAYL